MLRPWIRTALLKRLHLVFFDWHPFPDEELLQIVSTFENLALTHRRLHLDERSISATVEQVLIDLS